MPVRYCNKTCQHAPTTTSRGTAAASVDRDVQPRQITICAVARRVSVASTRQIDVDAPHRVREVLGQPLLPSKSRHKSTRARRRRRAPISGGGCAARAGRRRGAKHASRPRAAAREAQELGFSLSLSLSQASSSAVRRRLQSVAASSSTIAARRERPPGAAPPPPDDEVLRAVVAESSSHLRTALRGRVAGRTSPPPRRRTRSTWSKLGEGRAGRPRTRGPARRARRPAGCRRDAPHLARRVHLRREAQALRGESLSPSTPSTPWRRSTPSTRLLTFDAIDATPKRFLRGGARGASTAASCAAGSARRRRSWRRRAGAAG